MNRGLEARCKDFESFFSKFQPKYQDALNERGEAVHDLEIIGRREKTAIQRLETRTEELAKLKEAKAALEAELDVTRASLSL